MFFILVSLAFLIVIAFITVTQVIIPGYNGTPLFPFFRNAKLYNEVARLEKENEALQIQRSINKMRVNNAVEGQMANMETQAVENLLKQK